MSFKNIISPLLNQMVLALCGDENCKSQIYLLLDPFIMSTLYIDIYVYIIFLKDIN